MNTINNEALNALTTVMKSLLPDTQPILMVTPARITPTGLGGFVGLNKDPHGEIIVRRLEATVVSTVKAESIDGLNDAVTTVTRALLGVYRGTLLGHGILHITLDEIGPQSDGESNGTVARDLAFKVLYEFLKRPDASEDIIQQISINLDIDQTETSEESPGVLVDADFMEGSLDWFEVVDDLAARRSRPSQWQYNAVEARIEQLSNIWGGSSTGTTANKPGTYLVLRTNTSRPPVQDFILDTVLRSEDDDGIGLVFRWQDEDNFYFFLMHSQRNWRIMGKKVDGTFADLEVEAQNLTQGYTPGVNYTVRLDIRGATFQVYLDDERILSGGDSSLSTPGRVGFMCHGNNQSYFYRIGLRQV